MRTLQIHTDPPYEVEIGSGLLSEAGDRIYRLHAPSKALIVSDRTVDALYGGRVRRSLEDKGVEVSTFLFPPGESAKTWATAGELLERMAQAELSRGDVLVTLGGGVTGDLGGFAASVYLRGIPFVQLPTSLLAGVDASVGGKTAVDLPQGKNLAGAFHQPSLVLCDLDALDTLPIVHWKEGAAEALKCGILADRRLLDLFIEEKLQDRAEELLFRSVAVKGALVAEDPLDQGRRRLLNLGHTPAHAIERLSGFRIPHGQAVAMGLGVMAGASRRLGLMNEKDYNTIRGALSQLKLPLQVPYSADQLAHAARMDKKRSKRWIDLVIPYGVGDCRLEKKELTELLPLFRLGLEDVNG